MILPEAKLLRILVVDDEAPARQRISELLQSSTSMLSLYEAEDGVTGVELIRSLKPDIVFLDVQMPELNGLEVVRKIGPLHMPVTVFVTAYDQHALRAFEVNALDYLLKPFSDGRFEAAFSRASTRVDELSRLQFGEKIVGLLRNGATADLFLDHLVVRSDGVMRFVKVGDIESIEGAGVNVILYVAGREVLHRATLSDLSNGLDPMQFVRIHRSTIINIDAVAGLEAASHGEFDMTLKSGRQVRVSRTYRPTLEGRLKQSL